jgi:hypothetical protein
MKVWAGDVIVEGPAWCEALQVISLRAFLRIPNTNLIEEAEATVSHIQDKLIATKSQQGSYANKRPHPLECVVGDCVYLKVSP